MKQPPAAGLRLASEESRKVLTFAYRVLSGHDVHQRCKYYNILLIIL